MNTVTLQGTAATSKALLLATMLLQVPAVSSVAGTSIQPTVPGRNGATTDSTSKSPTSWVGGISQLVNDLPPTAAALDLDLLATRPTTDLEKVVGEIRRWRLLGFNWDGEGATSPSIASLKQAETFVRLLGYSTNLPEPMLHATGSAGLFWNENGLYADIEFLGSGRAAYYIERNGDKHKGVVSFNSEEIPNLFSLLLKA